MNPIRRTIGYADVSWNPVTGCRHGCPYCYARRMAERWHKETRPFQHDFRVALGVSAGAVAKPDEIFPIGFLPTFYPRRLEEPKRRRKPSVIFVSDMGDLFGSWVPAAWITRVLDVIRDTPWHRHLLLTKNPARYAEFDLPPNAWAGTTVTGDGDEYRAFELMAAVTANRWISYEPVLGGFPLEILRRFDWVTVGAMTGPGARRPKMIDAWVTALLIGANGRVPVFLKSNLGPQWEPHQEYPEGLVPA